MKRIAPVSSFALFSRSSLAVVVLSALAPLVAGCDEKDKAETPPASSSPAVGAASVASVAPVAVDAGAPEIAKADAPKKELVCPTGPELAITDPDLEAELRLKLGKPKGALKVADLANVRSLNLTRKQSLDELDPCVIPKLTNLKHLYLGPGKLDDLRPIANLTQLESLRASINEVQDLKPLEKLTMLDRLDLGRTHVRDIGALANLVNLTELQLDDTQVTDLSPLAKAKKLEKVSIKNTLVTDVSPLKDAQKLKFLYVQGTALNNVDTLAPLKARGLKIVTQ